MVPVIVKSIINLVAWSYIEKQLMMFMQPQGAATHNLLIQPIHSLVVYLLLQFLSEHDLIFSSSDYKLFYYDLQVVSEGIKIYNALSAGIVRLINKVGFDFV